MKKNVLCGILAAVMCLGFCACDSGDSSDESSFEQTENVKVALSDKISAIPEDADKEITYMGQADLNPTSSSAEISTELALFQKQGGSIKFSRVSWANRFSKVAAAVVSGKDIPDIVSYEGECFPVQAVQGMYQSIDSIVDLDSDMWSGVKDTAEQFVLDGEHYVAPLYIEANSLICYDTDVITENGLDDPYELYLEGNWNWDTFADIMREYCSAASADETRYGINGYFQPQIVNSTGNTFVVYNSEENQYETNLENADINKAENYLYDLMKEGLMYTEWIGDCAEAFKTGCLFYAMGDWAYTGTHTPGSSDNWALVPIPQYTDNPQNITSADIKAYMWIKGSTKSDAVKTWFECVRVANADTDYLETKKEKFMENNPNWTEDMYSVKMEAASEENLMLFDYIYGASTVLSDTDQGVDGHCIADILYKFSSRKDAEGTQMTWTQVREKYGPVVESEVEKLNEKIKEMTENQ